MQKDFDSWNEVKKVTNNEKSRQYNVREIWWCRLGINVGNEQDGDTKTYTRPCVILRGFGPNSCMIVPLTSSIREHPLRIPVGVVDGREARVNLSQIRVIDTRRFENKIGFLGKELFSSIRKAAKGLL